MMYQFFFNNEGIVYKQINLNIYITSIALFF